MFEALLLWVGLSATFQSLAANPIYIRLKASELLYIRLEAPKLIQQENWLGWGVKKSHFQIIIQ